MLAFVFVVVLMAPRTTVVYSLNFSLSMPRVVLGVTGNLTMSCHVTENDVSTVFMIRIQREIISGWDTIAKIDTVNSESPTLCKDIVGDKDFIVGGMLDVEIPPNSHLTLDMNILTTTLDDAGVYRCELLYNSNNKIKESIVKVERNATLLIEEADNKTEGRGDTLQCHSNVECVSKPTFVIVGVILGVAIILITIYASYITVLMRRIKGRNRHCRRCEMLNAAINDTSEIQNSSDEV